MKNLIYTLLFACVLCTCCKDKDEAIASPSLEVSAEAVDFLSDSGSQAITVSANVKWTYSVDEANSSWCSASADGDKLVVSVGKNSDQVVREASIQISAGALSKQIAVRQQGWGPSILVSPKRFSALPAIGANVEFVVTANVTFTITGIPAWMSAVELPESPTGVSANTYRYSVAPNDLAAQRSATLVISNIAEGSACSDSVLVTQLGSGSVSANIKSDIKIAVSGGEASSSQGGEGIEKSYDGDYGTIYHSVYNGGSYPITLTYSLTGADVLDYIVYHPRQSGGVNGIFREVEVEVKFQGSQLFTKKKDVNFRGVAGAVRVNFEPALENVAAVRFIVKSSVGDAGTAFASCAEMEFYKKNPDSFNPLTLFSDMSCSELKAGITQAEIEACVHPFFRNIALYMYQNVYPREFRIAEFRAYPDPSEEATINKTARYSKYDNPTGIAVEEGDTLIVFADGIGEVPVSLKIQNLDGEAANENYYDRGASYSLTNGANKIVAGNKGLAYVMYFRTDYATAPKLKLHFATGTVNGYFDVVKHGATAEWTRLLSAATHKYFDVVGRYAHLTLPTDGYRTYTQGRGVELINLYDKMMLLQWEFMGLMPDPDGYGNTANSHTFSNRMYFVVMYDGFMNASDTRTAYHVSTMSTLCSVAALLNETGNGRDQIWGPAHEVGHVNQTRPGLKWHGMTEVTNNLHSIYVQTHLHGNNDPLVNTRLQMESMRGEGNYVNRYEKAINRYFTTGRVHNSSQEDDMFCKLVPFWQLHLYLTEVRGIKGKGGNSFYADIYHEVRKDDAARTDGEHQLKFVERVCDKAQLNLEDFFSAYGFLTPMSETIDDYSQKKVTVTQSGIDATLVAIRKYPKPLGAKEFQYVSDENVEIFKSGVGIVAYELREGSEAGAIKRVYLNTKKPETLNPASIVVPSGQKLYSVDVTGSRVFIR
jgi:hypothetical protein